MTTWRRKIFEAAGATLDGLWNGLVFDGKVLVSENISEEVDQETKHLQVTAFYKSRHLIQTQYMTTVPKCDYRSCCPSFKTAIGQFFPVRRVPPLIPVKFSSFGPVALELEPNVNKQQINCLTALRALTTLMALMTLGICFGLPWPTLICLGLLGLFQITVERLKCSKAISGTGGDWDWKSL